MADAELGFRQWIHFMWESLDASQEHWLQAFANASRLHDRMARRGMPEERSRAVFGWMRRIDAFGISADWELSTLIVARSTLTQWMKDLKGMREPTEAQLFELAELRAWVEGMAREAEAIRVGTRALLIDDVMARLPAPHLGVEEAELVVAPLVAGATAAALLPAPYPPFAVAVQVGSMTMLGELTCYLHRFYPATLAKLMLREGIEERIGAFEEWQARRAHHAAALDTLCNRNEGERWTERMRGVPEESMRPSLS